MKKEDLTGGKICSIQLIIIHCSSYSNGLHFFFIFYPQQVAPAEDFLFPNIHLKNQNHATN